MTENQPGIGPGSPIWIDYTAGDFAAQQDFYTALFGWSFQDQGEEFGHYQMIRKGEATVGGAMDADLMAQQTGAPVQPAAWSVYLKTEDIQRTMQLTEENGGTVAVPPMAVGPLGHMAVVMSAGGEAVGFWQPGQFGGHDLPLTEGTSVWFEVMSTDFAADARFYTAVAGWDVVPMGEDGEADEGGRSDTDAAGTEDGEAGEGGDASGTEGGGSPDYATNFGGEDATAGLCNAKQWLPEGMPSFWRVYFQVPDMDAAVRTVQSKGGRVVDGPMDSPFGRVASVVDPAGATFQLNQPTGG
jgi:uncharacterized protein